jgi:hypothetical protein
MYLSDSRKKQLASIYRSDSSTFFWVNNNIRRVGIFRKDFQNFKTFCNRILVNFNSQKCKRFKKILSLKKTIVRLSVCSHFKSSKDWPIKVIYGLIESLWTKDLNYFEFFFGGSILDLPKSIWRVVPYIILIIDKEYKDLTWNWHLIWRRFH